MQNAMPTTRAPRRRGFTLLEVMIATSVLAVGTVSVLMVFATALAFANKRQSRQELAEVLAEARAEARVHVNAWQPPRAAVRGKGKAAGTALPFANDGKVAEKSSALYEKYRYAIAYDFDVRGVPEAGFRTTITVNYGDGQTHDETIVLVPGSVPDEEFGYSLTYDEEAKGKADVKGARETK